MRGRALAVLGTVVLTIVLIVAAAAFFVSRDDATVPPAAPDGPGTLRAVSPSQPPEQTITPGNIVLQYSDERLTRALRNLAERIAGPPDPALAAAGQAVLLQRQPNMAVAVTAVTAKRMLEASSPDDPALESFIEYWLGRKP